MIITDFDVAIVEDDSHLSKWVVEHGRLDVQRGYLDLFRRYIPEGGFVIDVGACLGDHTLTYSDFVGPSGVVHAFEPNWTAFECLVYNMSKRDNVFCHNLALGAVEGTAQCIGSIDGSPNLGANRLREGGDVKVVTLDSEYFARLDFIKIDAEGWEPDVLAGGQETIQRLKPVMLIEVNKPILEARGKSADSLYSQLGELGYDVKPSEPHHSFSMDMIDVICLPK